MATSGPATTWLNKDGLPVRFGPTESTSGVIGVFEDHEGGVEILEARIVLKNITTATATGLAACLDPNFTFLLSQTLTMEKVELFVETAATGSSATLSIGLQQTDFATNIATGAILNAETQSNLGTLGRRWIYTVSGGYLDGAPGTTSSNQGTGLGSPPGGVGSTLVGVPTVTLGNTSNPFTAGIVVVRLYMSYYGRDAILT